MSGVGLNRGVGLTRATSPDTELLTRSQAHTFADDGRRYGGPQAGPTGHRSQAWHRTMITTAYFYKITLDGEVVGGLLVSRPAWHHLHLVRIWVEPAHQGRGVGGRALALLEAWRRQATLWTVDVPAWAHRRRQFYKQNGYNAAREQDGVVRYEKHRKGILRLRSLP